MAFWRLFYHIVWVTKGRQPLLSPEIESRVHAVLVKKTHELNALMYAVNGMPDHVHVIAAIPPTLGLPDYVKQLKGSSSRFVHLEFGIPFEWQAGYGIFSISERNLKQAIAYVQNQKAHHEAGTAIPALERCIEDDDGPRLMFKTL